MTHISAQECTANLDSGVSNLLSLFTQASAQEIAQGKAWYTVAHDEAVRISDLYGIPLLTVVKVACALSPRLAWDQNMIVAESVIRWYVSGGEIPSIAPYVSGAMKLQRTRHTMSGAFVTDQLVMPLIHRGPTKVNIVKALWILQGHDWVLRGDKVNSFLDNILHPETSIEVTVDSHYIQCWLGKTWRGTYSIPPSFYPIIVADTRTAARLLGMTPLQFQAILWLVKKRLGRLRGTKIATGTLVDAIVTMLA